jgi:alkanesulfonate monooxygenase
MQPAKFHWRLMQGGETSGGSRGHVNSLAATGLPDIEAQARFCRIAEDCGIDSLLTDFGWSKPDPMFLAAAIGQLADKIKFIIAYRPGLICPTSFVHQLNTLSALIGGRFSVNVVQGDLPEEQRYFGDWLPHDERYARAGEFLAICRALWRRDGPVSFDGRYYRVEGAKLNTPFMAPDRDFPELFIAGNSAQAETLAIEQGTIWMQIADEPAVIAERGRRVLAAGKEIGLRLSVIGAPTRGAALERCAALVAPKGFDDGAKEREFVAKSDSVNVRATYELGGRTEWLRPWLWTGAVRTHGAPCIAAVGSPEEIADGFMEYIEAGVTQFILAGWPKLEEMIFFGAEVLPLIRKKEAAMLAGSAVR